MRDDFNREPVTFATGGYTSVIVANTLVAAIIIVALLVNGTSAIVAVITSGIYYALVTTSSLLILSGTVTTLFVSRQEQITARRTVELQWSVERPRYRIADPLHTPDDPAPQLPGTFVPAVKPVDTSARREASAWAMQLYGADGLPDGKKIVLDTTKERPGRLKIAAPKGDARIWLMDRHFLEDLRNGYRVRLEEYPTVEEFMQLL